MYRLVTEILYTSIPWVGFLIIFFIRYKFPHYSMHYGGGMGIVTLNDLEALKKCKIHTMKDIEKFRKRQRNILIFILITGIFAIPYLVILD